MHEDTERCVRAVQSKDARFDGWFFTAVHTTGIYCRPSCPAVSPKPVNMSFFPTAAAAQRAGFRACKRCRPDASPGSPQWNMRADVVARAMRLIADGVVDRDGVSGLAIKLGYSIRQIERLLRAEVGAGPLALARAQRGANGSNSDRDNIVADGASGVCCGICQHTDVQRNGIGGVCVAAFAASERASGNAVVPGGGMLRLRLPFRRPLSPSNLFGHLVATAVPGVEEWRGGAYRRTMRLPHGPAVVSLRPLSDHVECSLW